MNSGRGYDTWVPHFFNKWNADWTATRMPRRPKSPRIRSREVIRPIYIVRGKECLVLWFRRVIRTTIIVQGVIRTWSSSFHKRKLRPTAAVQYGVLKHTACAGYISIWLSPK
jgi:hypothetical protein